MNHCEVDPEIKKVKIIPRKYQYNFRTKRHVQRTGVMLVGWGGNNGSTYTTDTQIDHRERDLFPYLTWFVLFPSLVSSFISATYFS